MPIMGNYAGEKYEKFFASRNSSMQCILPVIHSGQQAGTPFAVLRKPAVRPLYKTRIPMREYRLFEKPSNQFLRRRLVRAGPRPMMQEPILELAMQ